MIDWIIYKKCHHSLIIFYCVIKSLTSWHFITLIIRKRYKSISHGYSPLSSLISKSTEEKKNKYDSAYRCIWHLNQNPKCFSTIKSYNTPWTSETHKNDICVAAWLMYSALLLIYFNSFYPLLYLTMLLISHSLLHIYPI